MAEMGALGSRDVTVTGAVQASSRCINILRKIYEKYTLGRVDAKFRFG